MDNNNIIDTPVVKSHNLILKMHPNTPKKKDKMTIVPYSSVIGSLIYSMTCIKYDICYVIRLVS